MMRVVFMGTPGFAVPCLESIAQEHEVVGVYCQPDKPMGRGKKLQPQPIKKRAVELGLEVYQPTKIKTEDEVARLKSLAPDCVVVVAYGQILSKEILDIPRYGCINVHASLLPKYRGAAPINWAIVKGEAVTGVTTMYMDVGLDTGDMLLKSEIEITDQMTAGELHDALSDMGSTLIVETLDGLAAGTIEREVQNHDESCYAPLMNKKTSTIDWTLSAKEVHDTIRGFNPWPVANSLYEGKTVKLWASEVLDHHAEARAGEIIKVSKTGIEVSTGKNVLNITEIQFSNSKRMPVSAYILGHDVVVGTVLGE